MSPAALEEQVKTALDAARKDFPRSPRVVELRHELGKAWTGDAAVWVWVILDDRNAKSAIKHAHLVPLAERVRTAISALAEEGQPQAALIPFVRFRLKSEQDENDREAGIA